MIRAVIVDDEPFGLDMLRMTVDFDALDIELAGSFTDAVSLLERIEELNPDLIITDIRMPEIDGLELIRRVRAVCGSNIRFVLISAYSQIDYAKEAINLGVKYYLVKPYFKDEAMNVMRDVCADITRLKTEERYRRQAASIALGRYALDIAESSSAGGGIEPPIESGELCYCVLGLFYESRKDCTTDMSAVNAIIREQAGIHIVKRGMCRMELLGAGNDRGEILGSLREMKSKIENAGLEHEFYLAVGKSAKTARELAQSAQFARGLAKQGIYRDDYSFMTRYAEASSDKPSDGWVDSLLLKLELGDSREAGDIITREARRYIAGQIRCEEIQSAVDRLVYGSLAINAVSENEALYSFYIKSLRDVSHRRLCDTFSRVDEYCEMFISRLKLFRRRLKDELDPAAQVAEYIREHYAEDITVREIASTLHFHPAYIGSLFKKQKGLSIHRYLHSVRVNRACEEMETGELSLIDIAMDAGYNDYAAFVSAFRAITGVSPSDYRKNMRAK